VSKLNTIPKTQHPDIHYKVMDLIQKNPDITQRQLASKLGISLGSMHYCVKALAHKGWVKVENFKKNPNKSAYLYLLTPEGISQKSRLAIDFLKHKKQQYQKLKSEIDELTKLLNI
jgi:EPS-associated MarR family transcriptional regulator